MPELSRPLIGDTILNHIITIIIPGSIFTRFLLLIHTPSADITAFTTTTIIGDDKRRCYHDDVQFLSGVVFLRRRNQGSLCGWEDEVERSPFSNL